MSDDRRDGSKPSFSELDKRKKGRGPRRERRPKSGGYAQKAYRAALERAFESGTVDELAATLRRPTTPAPSRSPAAAAPPVAAGKDDKTAPVADKTSKKPKKRKPSEATARRKVAAKIIEAQGSRDITAAIDLYLGQYGELPDDYEILEKALSHRGAELIIKALVKLERMIGRDKPRRSRSLIMQLTLLVENHADDEVCELAAKVREAVK